MLPYFRSYSIVACIIAVVPSLALSTAWPLITGQIMASSLPGLLLLFAVFIVSVWFGVSIMERKAQKETDKVLSKYNDDCDPQALVEYGKPLAEAITFPCKESGAWFMGYYAQALLDCGEVQQAREIQHGLVLSMNSAKKPSVRLGILVNIVPITEKLDGVDRALQLVDEGLSLSSVETSTAGTQRREFLLSQKKVLEERKEGDVGMIAKFDKEIRMSDEYPMRIRVEAAWNEAKAANRLHNIAAEKESLTFVSQHGNKLALTASAKARLSNI